MPTGHHLAKCLTCFTEFICGDCIESECKECQCKRLGHLWAKGVSVCCRCGAPRPKGQEIVPNHITPDGRE